MPAKEIGTRCLRYRERESGDKHRRAETDRGAEGRRTKKDKDPWGANQWKMIVPIGAPADGSSGIVEWVMIELNGELLKPLDEPRAAPGAAVGRQVELGSVKFDAEVSVDSSLSMTFPIKCNRCFFSSYHHRCV